MTAPFDVLNGFVAFFRNNGYDLVTDLVLGLK